MKELSNLTKDDLPKILELFNQKAANLYSYIIFRKVNNAQINCADNNTYSAVIIF